MAVKIVLKHSATEDKRPTPGQLENGEIALNYNEAGTFLTCRDTDGNIQQVGGVKISEVAPESPVKQTLWFQPSSLTLFVYDGNSFLPIAGGGGGGTPGGGITTIIGNNGIDASEIAGVVTLDVDLAGGDDGLEFNVGKLKASVANASQLGSVKIGDAITVTGNGTITPRIASASQTGIVKIGDGIDVALDGTISVDIPQTLVFRGSVDLNNPPTGQISPDPAQGGDAYVASVGANPVDNGWTGIGGESAVAGDLVVFDGTEWELISTGGTMQGVEGGAGITSTTSGGVATVAVDAGTGLSFDGDDKLIVDLDSGDLDGRYLRIDAGTFDQTVASTGDTTFSGLTKHANGITLTGNDFKVLGSNSTAKIFPGFNNSSPKSVTVSAVFPKVNSTTLKNFTLYNAAFDESSPNAALNEIVGYRAAGTLSGSGAGEAYGFHSELESVDGKQNFNFYAGEDAPNFFQGDTHIGGSISTTTRELWESTLTDEQKEQLAAGTLVVPANVAIPADGEFARQWWYDQQSEEDQALIDAGEINYPEHLQPANFVDTFSLGDLTNISLPSTGHGIFRNGLQIWAGNLLVSGNDNRTQFVPILTDASKADVNVVNNYTTVNSATKIKKVTLYNTSFDVASSTSALDELNGYRAALSIGQSGAKKACGFLSDVAADAGKENYNFYASTNIPSYFAGEVRGGGPDGSTPNWTIEANGTATGITVTRAAVVTDEQAGTVETLLDIITDLRARVEALEAAATA